MRLLDVIFLLIFINPVAQTDLLCDPPANPENGKVFYSSLDSEAELHYECNSGFILKNDQRRICSDDGTWSGIEPICQAVECDGPVPPEHGAINIFEDEFSVGSMVIYTCDEDRTLVGSASSRCLETGEWTFPPPRCIASCFVPKVNHGKIGRYVGDSQRKFEELPESSKTEDKEELYLRCEPNYWPFGKPGDEKKVVCSEGKWEAVPICGPVHCHVKDLKFMGLVKGNKTVYKADEVYNVTCRHGFTISKVNNQIKCVDGVWQGNLRPCITAPCNAEDLVKSEGIVPGDDKMVLNGESLNVRCREGYSPSGQQARCFRGQWNVTGKLCQETSCNAEDLVESEGIVPGDEKMVLDGELLNVRCREGYSPSGKQARCSRGQWNATGKLCEESSCTIHRIDNGNLSEKVQNKDWRWLVGYRYRYEYQSLGLGETRNPGSSVFLICDLRYSFQGRRNRTVLVTCSKGKWNPDPVCLRGLPTVTCPKFDESDLDIYYDNGEQVVHSTAVFSCKDPRKRIDGAQIVTCLSWGQWSGGPPKCKGLTSVKCPKFDDRDFVIYYDKDQAVNSTAVFSCKDFLKRIDGTQRVTCLSNGQWSGSLPKCKLACPSLPRTEGMRIIYSQNWFGVIIADIFCLPPRIRSGVSRTSCLLNGTWANPRTQCILPSCSLKQLVDDLPENVVPIMDNVNSDTLPYSFSLRLACNNNMVFTGTKVAKCGQDGSWQVPKIQCVIGCGFPKTGNSEMIIEPDKDFYRFGESVSLFCRSGYVLSSDVVRLLCLGLSWSETNVPKCVKK